MSIRVERWAKDFAPDTTELRKQMEAEGYIVTEHSDTPGIVHEPHDHSTDQSLWIISGSAQLRVGDENYTLNTGDRDFLPAHTEHSAIAIGDEMVIYLNGVKN